MTKQELENGISELKRRHWDSGKWVELKTGNSEDGSPECESGNSSAGNSEGPEQAGGQGANAENAGAEIFQKTPREKAFEESCQEKYRELKNALRKIEEAEKLEEALKLLAVNKENRGIVADAVETLGKLGPLVERRKEANATLAPLMRNGNIPDGGFVYFREPEFEDAVVSVECMCETLSQGGDRIALAAVLPDKEFMLHLESCPTKVSVVEKIEIERIKHVKGNWDCRGCMSEFDGIIERKRIEWCPRFLAGMRGKTLPEYFASFSAAGSNPSSMCYAGLLHSQFFLAPEYAELSRMCDTCGYRESDRRPLSEEGPQA